MPSFPEADRVLLRARGIDLEEAQRQVEILSGAPLFVRLVRPATVNDGIVQIESDQHERRLADHDRAQAEGRFLKFVPASGAATRMFRDLLHFHTGAGAGQPWSAVRSDPGAEAQVLMRLLAELDGFAFYVSLRAALAARGRRIEQLVASGEFGPVLAALLDADGLGYAGLPKGLLQFHVEAGRPRTPFEEHLAEAADYVRARSGNCKLHFTVSPEHRARFAALYEQVRRHHEQDGACSFDIRYSEQKPATDTLALDGHDDLVRDAAGDLLFRPAGHGALIENLAELGGDLVFIKNIDNVQPARFRTATAQWKRILGGYLVGLQEEVFAHIRALREGAAGGEEAAERFVRRSLAGPPTPPGSSGERREWLRQWLDRPLRVCGVVPNTGEPGGGPFWVSGPLGGSPQIVEGAQVDLRDAEQAEILRGSTHFNPVDLVCGLRDVDGKPYDLHRFIDPDTAIVTRKSAGGRDLVALERPGLWNGAMARWNTVFVEVPLETFTPVKTVLDLLRPEHQGR